uniref:Uncharacterized protein n=1 Tax=Oryza barthii TaxID=65489 RepID=A0A0D3HFT3_9ORYZ
MDVNGPLDGPSTSPPTGRHQLRRRFQSQHLRICEFGLSTAEPAEHAIGGGAGGTRRASACHSLPTRSGIQEGAPRTVASSAGPAFFRRGSAGWRWTTTPSRCSTVCLTGARCIK